MKGDAKAWAVMKKYAKQDVDLLKSSPAQGAKKSIDDDKYWKSKDSPKNW